MTTCKNCHNEFTITLDDESFYRKLTVPPPKLCPQCRLQRRMAWRNERQLYQRVCDLCHKPIIALFPASAPFPVYCLDCWWSDKWDPQSYGRDIDFSRTFFDQWHDLFVVVPKPATNQLNNENSEYNSLLAFSKNMYMCPGSYSSENCFYLRKSQQCRDCINSVMLNDCELVANSLNCDACYQSHSLQNCQSCSFSSYLKDCAGLQHCFMCYGIKNKQHCFKNQQYAPAEYEAILEKYQARSAADQQAEFSAWHSTLPKPATVQVNCEDCTGDYLFNSHQAHDCFDCLDIEQSKYLLECNDVKDSYDLSFHDKEIELCYELCSGGEKNYRTKFSYCACACPESEYLHLCFYLVDSFGCDGFHARAEHMILNKSYSAEEYIKLRQRLVTHMQVTGEYGEFFPMELSPFTYQSTVAQDYFPKVLSDQPDIVTPTAAQACPQCGKGFKILPQEKVLYDRLKLAAPTICFECRYQTLRSLKNPPQLALRQCVRCAKVIPSTYPLATKHVVYCNACYTLFIC